ncbi:TIM barrel protein [Algoriphagus zhangzhouensis]|uniref:Tat (Twin-arginine translocation) pathway signal sequence n=1 Tax=Algoriphagus zhangzhouensis TaxID=1073327 RepID=A0A1M7Z9E8_9BACT|nr:TIM barrel protein [Algoriphagus zhangzhouensis]TDY47400.1 secreted protein [Algoriphagus zhangzhouensis]SHO61541.1 Tat (twin-arginine translocation) pathway signal sequence [Algoriphagus zhangzhouensis]
MTNRRTFIKTAGLASAALGMGLPSLSLAERKADPIFKISLAEWSLNRSLRAGKLDHLDFALEAKKRNIDAVEYVNQFFMDKAQDKAYLQEMKTRTDGEGITNVLIMIDSEGQLGAAKPEERQQTVENHKKWVEAAKFLGCHSIRVNAYTAVPFSQDPKIQQEAIDVCSSTLRRICEFADDFDINVIIENHGGYSSNGGWLAELIKQTAHRRAGTLPDFGNFRMHTEGDKILSYDSYRGVDEMMPFAKGVSLKPTVWDDNGNLHPLDYTRMMKLVLAHDYHGYVGIEHGEEGREWESIEEIRRDLDDVRRTLENEA